MKHPHPFQQAAQQQINSALNACRNPIYCAPTGTGKTFATIQVIMDRIRLKELVFVLTPQEEIFDQWVIAATEAGIQYGTVSDGGIMGRNKQLYICMPLTLANILTKLPPQFYPDTIIIDECHHSEADTWQNIFTFFEKAHRLGLTATPKRTDGKSLANTYDMIINGDGEIITVKEAIQKNYLSDYLLVVPEEYKLNVPMQNGDFDTEMQAQILGEPRIIGNVIEWYGKIFAGLPVLVACSTFEHAKIMTEQFCAAGWAFDHIHSGLPKSERKRMLREIRTGKLNGLCTVGIGIEGLDIPGLFGLLWLRRTMSVTIYLQFIGRAIRAMVGKKYGIILDFIGNVFIHGLPDAHRTWTLDGTVTEKEAYDAPKMKLCPQCKVMNSEQNTKCHICGYDFVNGELSAGKKRGFPAMEDGRVVLLDDGDLAQRKAEIQEALKKQRDIKNAKEEKEKQLTELNRLDKIRLLKTGFENKSGLFADAVKRL